MQGKRIGMWASVVPPGSYWQSDPSNRINRYWAGVTPNGLIANLTAHNVVEHDDGTITVTPSIAVDNGEGGLSWHGYLTKGEWIECGNG